MNLKYILTLSSLSLVTGFGLVFGYIQESDSLILYGLVIGCSLLIGIRIERKIFFHGLLIGFIGGFVTWLIVYLLYPIFLIHNLEAKSSNNIDDRNLILLMAFLTGCHTGLAVGCLSWVFAKFKLGINDIFIAVRRDRKAFLTLRSFFYFCASIILFFASFYCFFMYILSTCSGHPPNTFIGIWIIPVSVFITWILFRFGKILWKKGFDKKPDIDSL